MQCLNINTNKMTFTIILIMISILSKLLLNINNFIKYQYRWIIKIYILLYYVYYFINIFKIKVSLLFPL